MKNAGNVQIVVFDTALAADARLFQPNAVVLLVRGLDAEARRGVPDVQVALEDRVGPDRPTTSTSQLAAPTGLDR